VRVDTNAPLLESFHRLRSLLTDLLDEAPASTRRIAEILRAVDQLESVVNSAGAAASPRPRTRGKVKHYTIQRVGDEDVLAEHRPDDPNPFRCLRSTYDAAARAMTKFERPVKYPEILKAITRELGSPPADYQVRVLLRFWSEPSVKLLERARARYKPVEPVQFTKLADQAWRRVRGLGRAS
jgi:hypothetical protein